MVFFVCAPGRALNDLFFTSVAVVTAMSCRDVKYRQTTNGERESEAQTSAQWYFSVLQCLIFTGKGLLANQTHFHNLIKQMGTLPRLQLIKLVGNYHNIQDILGYLRNTPFLPPKLED